MNRVPKSYLKYNKMNLKTTKEIEALIIIYTCTIEKFNTIMYKTKRNMNTKGKKNRSAIEKCTYPSVNTILCNTKVRNQKMFNVETRVFMTERLMEHY